MKTLRCAVGFTLVELMVVIAILAIIIAMGVPSFNTMIQNNRMVTATNDLNAILQYARAEAVRRGGRVGVESIGNDINNGVRTWADDDGDRVFDNDEELLRIYEAGAGNIILSAAVGGAGNQDISFSFDARGNTRGLNDTVTLGLCDDRVGDYGRQLTLLASGVVRLTTNTTCSGS